jgi:hypothetical protein
MRLIEIVTEKVDIPKNPRFIKDLINNKWIVKDTQQNGVIVYKGNYEDASLVCHNLNKKYYKKI